MLGNPNYKTILCNSTDKGEHDGSKCPYRRKCQFAHNFEELSMYTELAEKYKRSGICVPVTLNSKFKQRSEKLTDTVHLKHSAAIHQHFTRTMYLPPIPKNQPPLPPLPQNPPLPQDPPLPQNPCLPQDPLSELPLPSSIPKSVDFQAFYDNYFEHITQKNIPESFYKLYLNTIQLDN